MSVDNIIGANTSLFTWAYAPKCDCCKRKHNPKEDFYVRWYKGVLFGISPTMKGDVAMCEDCATKLKRTLKDLSVKIKEWRNPMSAAPSDTQEPEEP